MYWDCGDDIVKFECLFIELFGNIWFLDLYILLRVNVGFGIVLLVVCLVDKLWKLWLVFGIDMFVCWYFKVYESVCGLGG